jgi:hypothetical protein
VGWAVYQDQVIGGERATGHVEVCVYMGCAVRYSCQWQKAVCLLVSATGAASSRECDSGQGCTSHLCLPSRMGDTLLCMTCMACDALTAAACWSVTAARVCCQPLLTRQSQAAVFWRWCCEQRHLVPSSSDPAVAAGCIPGWQHCVMPVLQVSVQLSERAGSAY